MRGDHKDSERTDRHSSRVASAASPVQKSPNTPKKAHFSQFCTSRENFVPHQQPNRYKTLPAQPVQALTRYKTLPTRPRQQPNRYKTLPTRPKRPISASFARAGRTLYRFHHHDPQQGELCTALTITMPSKENFVPRPAPNPVQNSPCSAGPSAQPVQNSPNTPKKAYFSPFYPSGENFVPHPPPRPPAGRTLYRSHHHDAQQGELCTAPSAKPGTKLSLLSRSVGPTGTKLSQHAHTSSPTGTKLSQHTPPAAQPVQNSPNTHRPTSLPRISSPSTPKNGVFRLFCACWASFVAHKQPTGHAGRVFSRSMVRTDSPGGSFHWDRLLEPMSVAHGCDNGETTAGGASLRCLLRRVGAWPGSTRTIQTRPIGGCHVADRAWLRRPWAAAGPGRASKSTSEPSGSRVAISRAGRRPRAHQAAQPHSRIQQHLEHQRPTTTTHRHRPQMQPTGAPSSPAPQQDQTAPGTPSRPTTTTTDTTKRAGTSRFRPALDAQ